MNIIVTACADMVTIAAYLSAIWFIAHGKPISALISVCSAWIASRNRSRSDECNEQFDPDLPRQPNQRIPQPSTTRSLERYACRASLSSDAPPF